jgi:hypothetical protein
MFLDFLLQDGARIWQESQPHLRTPSAATQTRGKKRAPGRSSS